MHFTFTIFLDNHIYSTNNSTAATMALLTALGATGRVAAELEGQ